MKTFRIRTQKIGLVGSYRLAQALAVMLLVSASGIIAQAKHDNAFGVSIENFGRVNENYYRGAQPTQSGFAELKRLGVKTVIDLQEDGLTEEPNWVRSAGMQYFNIPLSSRRPATAEQTAYFLQLVNDANNWPVYVHCAGGRHRTGEMTAIYRITKDGLTADQAYQEMKQYQWYSYGGHKPLKDYVYEFYGRYKAGDVAGLPVQKAAAQATVAQAQVHSPDDGHLRIESALFKHGKELVISGVGLAQDAVVRINGAPVSGRSSFDRSKQRLEISSSANDVALQAGNQLEVAVGVHVATFKF